MKKFNPFKARVRATFAAGGISSPRLGEIDREAEVLHDVQITLEGEARGHGVWLDRAFCEDVAAAGNEMGEAGVKVRFGHPSMCSDALGTYLGRAKNFRVVDLTRTDGTPAAGVIADVHLAAEAHHAPSGDLAAWVLETATNSPDTFGQSIVFTYADHKVVDADGNEHSYKDECVDAEEGERLTADEWLDQSADGRVYAVLGKLHGTDFTDTPAATDGVFSAGDLAAEAEAMLEEHPEILSTIERSPDSVYQFLERAGILERIESKRVAHLQAAKDKEIAQLREDAALAAAVTADELATASAATKAAEERIASLNAELAAQGEALAAAHTQLEEKNAALAEVNAKVEQLRASQQETETALARTREQLSQLQKAHAAFAAGVLTVGEAVPVDFGRELKAAHTAEEKLAAATKYIKSRKRK